MAKKTTAEPTIADKAALYVQKYALLKQMQAEVDDLKADLCAHAQQTGQTDYEGVTLTPVESVALDYNGLTGKKKELTVNALIKELPDCTTTKITLDTDKIALEASNNAVVKNALAMYGVSVVRGTQYRVTINK